MRVPLLAVVVTMFLASEAAWAQDAEPSSDPAGSDAAGPGGSPKGAKPKGPVSRAFGGADLLVGRTMKQPVSDKVFTVGIDVGASPLDVGLSAGRDTLVKQAINSACQQSATCRDGADRAIKSLGIVSNSQWDAVTAAAGNDADLLAALQNAGVSATNAQQIVQLADQQVSPEGRQRILRLVRRSQAGAHVLLDPFIDVNLKWIDLKATIPFTLAHLDGKTSAYMANVGLEAKAGHAWEWGPIGVGLTGGLSLYLPTGMEGASAAQTADLLSAPKYAHGYLTMAPYLVAGVDFTWVTLQTSVEIDSMHGVRGTPAITSIQYLRYGVGLVILPRLAPKWTVSVIGEINGLSPIHNAAPYNAVFAMAGLQLRLYLVKVAVAVQVPLMSHKEDLGQISGIDVGSLAKYYVLTRLAFVF